MSWRAMHYALLASLLFGVAAHAQTLPLIPLPAHWQPATGEYRLTAATVITVPGDDPAALRSAQYLAAQVAQSRGLRLQIRQGRGDAGIVMQLAACKSAAESYTLDSDAHGVRIGACDEAGLFYGAVTAWQLLTADPRHGDVLLRGLHVQDRPRFAWRGLMLDSARHFQSVDEIKRLLDQMALHKLNVFHWHLSDDQGWRLQIKRYPRLTDIGAWRTPPTADAQAKPARYGGFYTQAQVRDIVAYAAIRHITVVPELDLPGHAQAAIAAYPELGVTGTRPAVGVNWGVNPWLYRPDAQGVAFIEQVLDEVMTLFPSTDIHIGGDEAVKDQWQASPAVQAQMAQLGIHSEDALQSWLVGQLGAYLAQHGRRLIGWDEILQGGLPASANVMSWRGRQGALDAAKLGHDTVLTPAPYLYLDNLQSLRQDEPSGRLSVQTLETIYRFEPTKGMTAAQSRHLLGVEAALWTEYMTSDWHVEHAVFPRLDALAELAWSPAAVRRWPEFLARLPTQLRRYRSAGIQYADSAYAVDFHSRMLTSGQHQVSMDNQLNQGVIRYTLDGSPPGPGSSRYESPLTVADGKKISAAVYTSDGYLLAATRESAIGSVDAMTRDSSELQACPNGELGLRVPLTADATATGPVFNIDLFHSCWIYPPTSLDAVKRIHVAAARLARNFALAHEQSIVIGYRARSSGGELEVHQDRCDGPLLAAIALPALSAPSRFDLAAAITPMAGEHALCLRYTAPIQGPLYAIDRISLLPATPSPVHGSSTL